MGSSNIIEVNNGDIASEEKWNQYMSAFTGDIVPRNASGVATDGAGDIGSVSHTWGNGYFENLTRSQTSVNTGTANLDSGEYFLKTGQTLDFATTPTNKTYGNFDTFSFTLIGPSLVAIFLNWTGKTTSATLTDLYAVGAGNLDIAGDISQIDNSTAVSNAAHVAQVIGRDKTICSDRSQTTCPFHTATNLGGTVYLPAGTHTIYITGARLSSGVTGTLTGVSYGAFALY